MNIRATKGLIIFYTKRQKFVCGDHPLGGGNEYSHVSIFLRFPNTTVLKDLLRRSINTTRESFYSREFQKYFHGLVVPWRGYESRRRVKGLRPTRNHRWSNCFSLPPYGIQDLKKQLRCKDLQKKLRCNKYSVNRTLNFFWSWVVNTRLNPSTTTFQAGDYSGGTALLPFYRLTHYTKLPRALLPVSLFSAMQWVSPFLGPFRLFVILCYSTTPPALQFIRNAHKQSAVVRKPGNAWHESNSTPAIDKWNQWCQVCRCSGTCV